jgi:hypothetical protein
MKPQSQKPLHDDLAGQSCRHGRIDARGEKRHGEKNGSDAEAEER